MPKVHSKYCMERPICQACKQRFCAINYHKDQKVHYRTRCESCLRRNRKIKPRQPRWQSKGYVKKMVCDLCKFKARYSQQILVYHIDGDLNNCDLKNLKSVCQNCTIELARGDLPWKQGDLEPDR